VTTRRNNADVVKFLPAGRQGYTRTLESMYYVYILKSLRKKVFYKGFTDDLDRRLCEHKNGLCQTTKNLIPFELVFVQICETRDEARNLEKYLKSGSGREIIREFI